jgi:hypothetical protein
MAKKKAKKNKKAKTNPKDITITIGPPIAVHPDPVDIYISKNEVAHWKTNPPNQDFLVVFEGNSPFDDWYFHPSKSTSKAPKAHPDPNITYKYFVFTDKGASQLDPGVIIKT